MNKVMILGAGIYQVPLIKKANELGYYTIVCSVEGNYPGFKYANKVYYVDTTDMKTSLEIARKENIIAVCTTGTDVALPTLGYIVDNMNLKGPSEKSAVLSSNKYLMQEAFHKNGVKSARFFKIESEHECLQKAKELGYPCIIKVVDNSGSRGIQIVQSESSLIKAYQSVLQFTRQDYVIIEEFLDGEEFGAQAFVCDGNVLFVMPHSDEVYKGNTGVPIGHHVPFIHKNANTISKKVYYEIKKAIKALEIDNAAVNVDMILVNETPYILEIGARGGGTCLPELVALHYNVDYYGMIVELATGRLKADEHLFHPCKAVTGLLVTSPVSGVLKDYNLNIKDDCLYDLSIDYLKGQKIHKFETGPDRIGQLIVYGDDAERTRLKAFELLAKLNLKIEVI